MMSKNRLKNLLSIIFTISIIALLLKWLGIQIEIYGINNAIYFIWVMNAIIFVWAVDEIYKSIESLKKD